MVWECCTSKPAIRSRRIYPAWRQKRKSAVRWWVALDTESCAYIGSGQHWTTAYLTGRYTPIACILLVHTPTLCASSLTEIARCSTWRRCGLCATSNQRSSGVWCSLCCARKSKKHSSIQVSLCISIFVVGTARSFQKLRAVNIQSWDTRQKYHQGKECLNKQMEQACCYFLKLEALTLVQRPFLTLSSTIF